MKRRDFIKTCMAGAALANLPRWSLGQSAPAARPPNIVFILTDDLGFDLLSCYGSDQFKTPQVDALAAKGIRFRYCHTSPVCGPSRCQVVTGQYPFRSTHCENNPYSVTIDPRGLPSVAQILKGAGYATAQFGKWHMSKRPQDWGFDEGDSCEKMPADKDGKRPYIPDVMQDRAAAFMQSNQARPFFLWYCMRFVHANFMHATPDGVVTEKEFREMRKFDPKKQREIQQQLLRDNLAGMDKMVGRLVAEIDRLGLTENTLVVFAGDNGTAGKYTIGGRTMAGAKRHQQDGGPTVPLIVSWPGTVPAGKVSDDLVGFVDFLPTFAELAGTQLPKDTTLDGVSFAPQLRGQKGKPREYLFNQYRNEWFVRNHQRKLYHDGRLVDTNDYPFKEKPLPADAEPELRGRFQKVLDDLQVAAIMRAHPEWLSMDRPAAKAKP